MRREGSPVTYIGTNLIAILAATLAGLAFGVVFHAMAGRAEGRGNGLHSLRLLIVSALAEFWLAAILAGALILAPVEANAWTITLVTPVVIWIGFVVPVLAVSYTARRLGLRSLLLDAAHWLAVMVGQGAVLHLVGLAKP